MGMLLVNQRDDSKVVQCMFRRHFPMEDVCAIVCCRSSPPTHVITTASLGFPSHRTVSSPPLRASSIVVFTALVVHLIYHPTLSDTVLVAWPKEYELIVFKVVARGRTHRAIIRHAVRLSEHYNHSSSTPGRRSHTFVGVQSNEIGKGYHYY